MSSPKDASVVDGSSNTSWPQNSRKHTSIDQISDENTEKRRPKNTEKRAGHKHKSPSRVQKNTARTTSRMKPKAQSKASTKSPRESPTNLPQKPPKLVRFYMAEQSSQGQPKEKQRTTTVEEEDNLDGTRALEGVPDPMPSVLTQEDLEQMLPPKPLLPRTDAEFEDRYRELKAAAMTWVKQHFSKDFAKPLTSLDMLQISKNTPELIQYINYIVSSGKNKWEDIFVERRIALVYGVLGKAIEIHVFGEEMFGASDRQRITLRGIDLEMRNKNGFTRQKVRACTINAFLSAHDRALPPEFASSIARLHARLSALVWPLLSSAPVPKYHHDLSRILFLAAKLSLDMRREPATIYYTTPLASSGEFHPRLTDILNPRQLAAAQPYREDYEQPVIRVSAWPSVFAYRPGTGREGGEEDGFRTRRIAKSEAYVKWGSLIPFSRRAGFRMTYPANSEPNTSLCNYLNQQHQELEGSHDDASATAVSSSSSSSPSSSLEQPSSEEQQQQTEPPNRLSPLRLLTPSRILMARRAAGGIGIAGAVLAASTYGGEIAQVAGTVGGEAAELLKGLF